MHNDKDLSKFIVLLLKLYVINFVLDLVSLLTKLLLFR
jgi:hypothetical protein